MTGNPYDEYLTRVMYQIDDHPAMSPGEAKRLWEHYNRIFVWNYTPGVLWWSKENS